MAKKASGTLLENIKTILYAGLIAVGIRTVAFEPFNIPSGSMEPTLLIGDYLFVSKYSYGYSRYSLPLSLPLFSGRILGRLPERGDVAVFRLPYETSTNYIKRIIGLPGDRIQVRAGDLYINGTLVPRTQLDAYGTTDETTGQQMLARLYTEVLPNGVTHRLLKEGNEGTRNNTIEYSVPPGYVFAMGDNRDNSADSRFKDDRDLRTFPGGPRFISGTGGVSFLPVENLVGRAEFIFFSVNATKPWWQVWEWPSEIRWSRLLHGIS